MKKGDLVRIVAGVLAGRVGIVDEVGDDFVVLQLGAIAMHVRLPLDHVKSLR